MRNYPSIFERAKAYENGNNGVVTPSTHIVINTNRLWYGKNSTGSAFLATAYDEQGNWTERKVSGYDPRQMDAVRNCTRKIQYAK